MKCDVCSREIAYEETMYQISDTKESVCMHNGDECLSKHMLENLTATLIDECFNDIDFKAEKERFRQKGLQGVTTEDREILLDWYKANFAWKCENDEPDETTLREWNAERQYQLREYYRMAYPA